MKRAQKLFLATFAILTMFLTAIRADAGTNTNQTAVEATAEDESKNGLEIEDEFDEFDNFEEFNDDSKGRVFDPLSGYNRFMTTVNDKLYYWAIRPVARGYRIIAPKPARLAVNRFFKNLGFPLRFVNNLLQLKFKRAGIECARFGVNSTIGILGLWDPAKAWLHLEPCPEDFGQTLGRYGVGSGFCIVLPVLGPSNLRDAFSLVPDYFLNPASQLPGIEEKFAVESYNVLNTTSLHLGEYESLQNDALDFYTFMRDAYEQNRKKQIRE